MPKAFSIPLDAVHLWVKQGKTDHMAILEDPVVLSKLEERRKSESFSLADLSVLDLGIESVSIRWATTGQKAEVEASTIRFRDLQAEGRGSKRSSRRREAPQSEAVQSNNSVTTTQKRKRKRNEQAGSKKSNSSKSKGSTNVSSIVTADSIPDTLASSDEVDSANFDSSDSKKKRKTSKTSRKKRKQNETNFGDRGDLGTDEVAPPNNGKTNVSNFLRMKQFFSSFLVDERSV